MHKEYPTKSRSTRKCTSKIKKCTSITDIYTRNYRSQYLMQARNSYSNRALFLVMLLQEKILNHVCTIKQGVLSGLKIVCFVNYSYLLQNKTLATPPVYTNIHPKCQIINKKMSKSGNQNYLPRLSTIAVIT